ncbi:MAG: DNA polymerase III subunit gamma/tau [Planctomycetota bacterium]|nr:MAG: DNA polymerase III subunit gamma/tau [Planctomycetota bacterium]
MMSATNREPSVDVSSARGAYTVLARRYRSRNFDELIGQEPISRTLQNAIKSGRAAHAYLFCGTRGVGKTSMARILAAALNVTDDLLQADEIAAAIFRGDDLDVIEIDGASNRGINEARELIAGAGLSPARCRYKIYIIDEVHQITKDAFNALLKTMEEPPAHVKFILCTTEPQKVPATIQSRCQRFDFRSISTPKISGQLRKILDAEGVEADEQVLTQVARLGRGSMRDALSLLDRLLAAGEGKLTPDLLEQMLGLPDHALAEALVDAIADGDAGRALNAAADLLERGTGIEQSLEILIEHLRNLMLIDACGEDSELVELAAETRKTAARQASRFDAAGLAHMIAVCDAVSRSASGSAAGRALFDAAIVRLCMSERFADITALLEGTEPRVVEPKKKDAPVSPAQASPPAEPAASVAGVIMEPRPPQVRPREPGSPGPTPVEPATTDPGEALWKKTVAIAADSANEHALVEHLVYRSFDGTTLRLAIQSGDEGLARWLGGQCGTLTDLVMRATSRRVEVVLDLSCMGTDQQESQQRREAARERPLVRTAMEIFDAEVIDVLERSVKQDKERPDDAG